MQTPISIKDKKSFIQWFLNNYQLKKRESVWILNYLINHHEVLTNVHFVRDAKFCPRSIIISTHCSKDVPFRFYKDHLVTTDPEKSFHDIRLNQDETLYVQLNFRNANQNTTYAAVLEDNPFVPDEYFITRKDKDLAKQIMDHSIQSFRRKHLIKKIDQALDKKCEDEFHRLVEELKKFDKDHMNQPK
ncbi:ReoY family proteolytic degradation factor [Ornithinibacillus salinisoli]|uniref:UPF0302 protein ACFSJF_16395 n=1 Tax=Ornithinibacillus salinisoli TaxID=1848459 RepID=A0ABW4W230_9BACI